MIPEVVIAVLIFLNSMALLWYWQEKQWKLPPGPKGVPLFGNLLSMMLANFQGEAPFVTLSKWAFQYGPLSYMRFGTQRVVVIADAQLAQQMCVKMADNFSARPTGLFIARVLRGRGIVMNDGKSWKSHRVFIQSEFRKFGFSRQSIETPIELVSHELVQQLEVWPLKLFLTNISFSNRYIDIQAIKWHGMRPSHAFGYRHLQHHLERY